MSSGKRILKWGMLALASLIYLAICAIPFFQFNPTKPSNVELGKSFVYSKITVHPIWLLQSGEVILTLGEVIVLGVMAAILIAVVVLGIKYREKVKSTVGKYESEVKRITWFPWKDTKKSTVVVLIAVVICATVICLLDAGLSWGILKFVKLF